MASDKIDLFSDDEITEIIKDLKPKAKVPWLDYHDWAPKQYKCDCGGQVAKTTCANWCTLKSGKL